MRLEGYRRRLEECGLEYRDVYVGPGDFTALPELGRTSVLELVTTLQLPTIQAGTLAKEMLLYCLSDSCPSPEPRVISCPLIVRGSCGPLPHDSYLTQAPSTAVPTVSPNGHKLLSPGRPLDVAASLGAGRFPASNSIQLGVPPQNYCAMLDGLRAFGKYPLGGKTR